MVGTRSQSKRAEETPTGPPPQNRYSFQAKKAMKTFQSATTDFTKSNTFECSTRPPWYTEWKTLDNRQVSGSPNSSVFRIQVCYILRFMD